jgi:hypothetical protein
MREMGCDRQLIPGGLDPEQAVKGRCRGGHHVGQIWFRVAMGHFALFGGSVVARRDPSSLVHQEVVCNTIKASVTFRPVS